MSLNIALTGINAANTDLSVVSDNIANANTTGFKRSRAEFGDLVDSMSVNGDGLGVRLQRMTQTFKQGSVETTDNTFDMAIVGEGFFQVKDDGGVSYTRAGSFRTDTGGYIVNNLLQNVQGYTVQVSSDTASTEVEFSLTLAHGLTNAAASFNASDPLTYNHITSTNIFDSKGFTHDLKSYFLLTTSTSTPPAAGNNTWQIYHQIDGGATIDGGTVVFDNATGIVSTAPSVTSLSLSSADLGTGAAPATITLNFGSAAAGWNIDQGSVFNIASLTANGSLSAREVTQITGDLWVDSSTMQPKMTGHVDVGVNLNAMEEAPIPTTIVDYTVNLDGSLAAIAAAFDPTDPTTYHHSNLVQVYDSLGINHSLQTYFVKTAADDWSVYYTLDGQYNAAATPPDFDGDGGNITFAAATGAPTLATINTPITFSAAQVGSGATALTVVPDFSKALQILGDTTVATDNLSTTTSVLATSASADPGTIDATNADNYAYSTSLSIYDSLGIGHVLNLYFRKTADNAWSVYKQIPEIDSIAERVGSLTFDSRGMPVAAKDNGDYTDSQNPTTLKIIGVSFGSGAGRQNFELNFADTTQFDSQSITNSLEQDGYTMGNLSGVEADESGNIIASYSNGETQIMGQVALARFANTQGLKRVGDNNWIATQESGQAISGKPDSGSLGKVVAGALEGSNVELTKELVDMISAQRNFQANAQVINTTGTLYQAILNVR
ncbi:MAG: flagellar hook-basal body complex protein [Gammaproteobacteria bacterium]|nr:flagellar hook-basal body complex protein [Gammaproteobacteria bacterium]MCP5195470.1 flagellar hook-basal body complex protein [Gammaproteobacteria bacterium]